MVQIYGHLCTSAGLGLLLRNRLFALIRNQVRPSLHTQGWDLLSGVHMPESEASTIITFDDHFTTPIMMLSQTMR